MLKEIFFYTFVVTGIINIIHFGLNILGANIYDIQQMLRKNKLPRRLWSKQPLVSVVIPAHNEETVIERCLDSVRRNTYKNIEVFVHNDLSTDNTRRLVASYQKKYPNFHLRLVNRHRQAGKAGGVNYCVKRYAKGEFVMTLDADSMIHRDAIRNALVYFRDPKVMGVAANVQIIEDISVLGLLQKFEHIVGYRSKKFYSVANCEFIVGGVASTYRREIMKRVKYYDTDTVTEDIGLSLKVAALGNKQNRIVYGADVLAMTEGVETFKQLLRQRYRWKMGMLQNLLKRRQLFASFSPEFTRTLTLYRIPMAYFGELMLLAEPFVLVYILYLSIIYHTLVLVLGAYFTITAYILWNLWPDEHLKLRNKLIMSLFAPVMYFTFYIMSAVQIISILRCLLNFKQVLRIGEYSEAWVSPTRKGKAAQFS